MKNFVRDYFPNYLHELLISLFNCYQMSVRYGGDYKKLKKLYSSSFSWDEKKLKAYSEKELASLLEHAVRNSNYYKELLGELDKVRLSDFPVLTKNDLCTQLANLQTISDKSGVVNFTGGTTGSSTKNVFTKLDVQKRHAFLDAFRELYGYKLGLETAWFSGKELLSKRDIKSKRFFKRDFIHKINYFSTFHITISNVISYVEALNKQKPKFLVGFPSSIVEIAVLATELNLKLTFSVMVVFPTAEKVTKRHREVIHQFYGAKVVDQYASSEGAPFITECHRGNYHLQEQTGFFELLNTGTPNTSELLVTSFSTYGTPLIRYQIGDTVQLTDEVCMCGDSNPIVKEIGGRTDDYLTAFNGSRVNLGNLSNATKNVKGILQFQAIQNSEIEVDFYLVKSSDFNQKEEQFFLENLRYRLGAEMKINLYFVDVIPVEKSGKFRIVKNNIKGKS